MCGIVGYVGESQAAPILLEGLSKLEYRGYESAGLAVRDGAGRKDQADGNNDGPGDDRRKEPHDLAHAEHFDESAEDHVDQPGYYDAARRIRQHLAGGAICTQRGHSSIAAQERKAGTEERRHLALCQQMEQ